MDPSMQASLAALRDIHLPDAVSIWPPAPGWWLVAGLLLLLAGSAALLARSRRHRRGSWEHAAALELAGIEEAFAVERDAVSLATALSSLLRRSVLARCPEAKVAALHGDAWFEFLCGEPPDPEAGASGQRSPEVVRNLTETAYAGAGAARVEPDAWIAFVRSWIGAPA